jgi:diguanylate cyclase (GGDEF)-like protein
MPHGMCYLWNAKLIALHSVSDAIIAFAYLSLPVLLACFWRKYPKMPFRWLFSMVAAFITFCGFTHLVDIWTIWHPAYWFAGWVKAATAAASLATIVTLAALIPQILQFRSPTQLAEESADYLEFAAMASEKLAGTTTLQSTLDALEEIVVPELADCVVVNLIDRSGVLRTAAVRAIAWERSFAAKLVGLAYAKPQGPPASAAAIATNVTQVQRIIDDSYIGDEIDKDYIALVKALKLRASVVVPLRADDDVLGTLAILRTHADPRPFNKADVLLCEALASRAISAIRNARHYEELAYAAYHDELTGLANRLVLSEKLSSAVADTRATADNMSAVLFVDIDRFKLVNDSHGHLVGDRLLVAIARRLETCIRANDTVARVGSDEFAILMPSITNDRDAIRVAQRILSELTVPFEVGEHEVYASASIGVALNSGSYLHPEELMRDADIAMYCAKRLGKQRFTVFEPIMRDESQQRLRLDTEIRHAVKRGEVELFYQPIVSLETGVLEAFEALARWRHPSLGLISPMDFIPIAEETGSIIELGTSLLQQACMQMRSWQTRFPAHRSVAVHVNVSAKQVRECGFVQTVRDIVSQSGADPKCLHLEITETALMQDQVRVAGVLAELRAFGVSIDIDDFGTGYSSLAYLHTFPFDTLKIDRSFVSDGGDGLSNPQIVATILSLAKNLHLRAVAEGIETDVQRKLLRALGCQEGQGYYFSRPMAVTALEAYLGKTASLRLSTTSPRQAG